MKLPDCPALGEGRDCDVALKTGGSSPQQEGGGERGRQACVGQALEALLEAKAGETQERQKSKQKPFAMSHLIFVAILKSCNSVKWLLFKSQTRLVMFANQVK